MTDGGNGGGERGEGTAQDEALWRLATRDVTPLAGRRTGAAADAGAGATMDAGTASGAAARRRADGGLDGRQARRLRRGETPIDGRLDLHGMRQEEARRALAGFLAAAQGQGWRCVLVITGKGQREPLGERRSVLRAALPRWLDEAPNRERVLGFAPARPRHGGDGAFYVLLRKSARRGAGG